SVILYSQLPKCEPRMEYRMIADSCEPSCEWPQPACISRAPSHRMHTDLPRCRCQQGFYRSVGCHLLFFFSTFSSGTRQVLASLYDINEKPSSVTRVKRDSSDGVDYSSLHASGGHSPLESIVNPMAVILNYPMLLRALFAAR
ncbi:hypothetical protein PENTCL1PPCAC_16755, partial [Pristionchus entomophagus]